MNVAYTLACVSDQGFWIIDAHLDGIDGVLDHGLFIEMTIDVLRGRTRRHRAALDCNRR